MGLLDGGEGAGTQWFAGTSAAAPFVTGTLVALLSADSTLSPQKAVKLLERYLDDAGAAGLDPTYGGGLLNWDRLRERTTTDVSDVALASIYLQPDAQPGTTMPIQVTAQNRGTRWLTAAELPILVVEEEPLQFTVRAGVCPCVVVVLSGTSAVPLSSRASSSPLNCVMFSVAR